MQAWRRCAGIITSAGCPPVRIGASGRRFDRAQVLVSEPSDAACGDSMPDKDDRPPFDLFGALHKSFLQHLKSQGVLDVDDIPLFEWYEQEHSKTLDRMFAEERAFIKEQEEAGADVPNDSGIVAVEYYVRRLRNADVIQLTSLLESFLERACDNLKLVIGDSAVVFGPYELSGNRWERFRKFLERYAHFKFPAGPWSDLRVMIDIRNNIVHDNGVADWDRPGGEYLLICFPSLESRSRTSC